MVGKNQGRMQVLSATVFFFLGGKEKVTNNKKSVFPYNCKCIFRHFFGGQD